MLLRPQSAAAHYHMLLHGQGKSVSVPPVAKLCQNSVLQTVTPEEKALCYTLGSCGYSGILLHLSELWELRLTCVIWQSSATAKGDAVLAQQGIGSVCKGTDLM